MRFKPEFTYTFVILIYYFTTYSPLSAIPASSQSFLLHYTMTLGGMETYFPRQFGQRIFSQFGAIKTSVIIKENDSSYRSFTTRIQQTGFIFIDDLLKKISKKISNGFDQILLI